MAGTAQVGSTAASTTTDEHDAFLDIVNQLVPPAVTVTTLPASTESTSAATTTTTTTPPSSTSTTAPKTVAQLEDEIKALKSDIQVHKMCLSLATSAVEQITEAANERLDSVESAYKSKLADEQLKHSQELLKVVCDTRDMKRDVSEIRLLLNNVQSELKLLSLRH